MGDEVGVERSENVAHVAAVVGVNIMLVRIKMRRRRRRM